VITSFFGVTYRLHLKVREEHLPPKTETIQSAQKNGKISGSHGGGDDCLLGFCAV
jgi:hypothetical protein